MSFVRARRLNAVPHEPAAWGRTSAFRHKCRAVENAIRLAPESLYVDDFQLRRGGTVGITMPGEGRLHVKLGALSQAAREFVWRQILLQCCNPFPPAA